MLSYFSCVRLFVTYGLYLPGSFVHGILQARILEWVILPPPGDPPHPEIEPMSLPSPALVGESLPLVPPVKP